MKVAFHTLGCKTNSYETQAMREQMEAAGFTEAAFTETADVYVINTCSVTAVASQKSRQMLHRCRKLSPEALIVACGCYAQEASKKLSEEHSVDLVIGNNEKSRLSELVKAALKQKKKSVAVGETPEDSVSAQAPDTDGSSVCVQDLTHCRAYETQTITNAGSHVRAYVKIQDGCDRFCSYCIIPFLRGRSRSRSEEEILAEVSALAEHGCQEVVLTGIDISDYHFPNEENGVDAHKQENRGMDLAQLIEDISRIRGVQRIRLGSLEEGLVTDEFVARIRQVETFCPHFHLSMQSGCDATLKRMNRHYTTKEFAESVELLRKYFHHPAITTDVIAGFPQETEEEFAQTADFIRQMCFSQMHVFPYSRREGTVADRMEGQLTKAKKNERAGELIRIGQELQEAYMQQFLHQPVDVLIEEVVQRNGRSYGTGFTPEYVRVLVPADGTQMINKIVTIYPEQIATFGTDKVLITSENRK